MSPNRNDLEKWRKLAGAGGLVGSWALPSAIDEFLGVPAPKGSPAGLRELAGVYRAIALDADQRFARWLEAVAAILNLRISSRERAGGAWTEEQRRSRGTSDRAAHEEGTAFRLAHPRAERANWTR